MPERVASERNQKPKLKDAVVLLTLLVAILKPPSQAAQTVGPA